MHYLQSFATLFLIVIFAGLILISPFGIYAITIIFINKDYALNVWIGIDQLGAALLGRNPDVTISSDVGYHAERGNKTALILEKVINAIFYHVAGEQNHCRNAIERDEY